MLGNYRVAAQLVAIRVVLSPTELVKSFLQEYRICLPGVNSRSKKKRLSSSLQSYL
jgi:hypothetical protein